MSNLIFGIDHGNGNIKTESFVFPCGLTKQSKKPPKMFSEDILEYKGMYYILSDTRLPYKQDKTKDMDYFVLTLFALAKEAQKKNLILSGKDIILSVGLPPAEFGQSGRFKKYFTDESRHGVTFRYNDKESTFYIKDVYCTPQNFAAVVAFESIILKTYPTVNCIDIGDGTVDLLVLTNGKPDMNVRVSNRSGMAVMRAHITSKIQQDYNGYLITGQTIEHILMGKKTIVSADIQSEVRRMAGEWARMIIEELLPYVPEFKNAPAIILGGGSILLHDAIMRTGYFNTDIEDALIFMPDIRCNAKGYKVIAENLEGIK